MYLSLFVHYIANNYQQNFVCVYITFVITAHAINASQTCGRFQVENPILSNGNMIIEGNTINITFSFINTNCAGLDEISIEVSKLDKKPADSMSVYAPQCTITHILLKCQGSNSDQVKCVCLNNSESFRYNFQKNISGSDITQWRLSTPHFNSTPLLINFKEADPKSSQESSSTDMVPYSEDNKMTYLIVYFLGALTGIIFLVLIVIIICITQRRRADKHLVQSYYSVERNTRQ